MSWLKKVTGFLGKLTDALMWGRKRGLWTEKHGPTSDSTPSDFDRPHRPGPTR